ncbi:MAG: C4-dicarboxylate ABC transporter, partial [Burkholderiaceae bacterium]
MSSLPARRALLLTLPLALTLAAPAGQAQTLRSEYKLSVVANRPIPIAAAAFRWAELVAERSNGRINIKVYPGSSLVGGDNTREFS